MARIHLRSGLSFSAIVRFIIFLSITDVVAACCRGNETAVNLAFEKTAVQLSTYISPAVAALDGDLTTASCTSDESYPWWAVDLGQDYNIGDVKITSPDNDGYVSGLDNFEVGVSKVFPNESSPVTTGSYTLCGRYNGSVTASQIISVSCASVCQKFRYVVIRSSDATAERLCMAEVAIYESTHDCSHSTDPADGSANATTTTVSTSTTVDCNLIIIIAVAVAAAVIIAAVIASVGFFVTWRAASAAKAGPR